MSLPAALWRIIKGNPASAAIVAITVVATILSASLPGVHRPEVIVTFVLIIALSLAGILLDPRPYSLCQLFCLFCLVFMGVAPLSLYVTGTVGWWAVPFASSQYVSTNMLIIICLLVFLACAYYHRPALSSPIKEPSEGIQGTFRSNLYLVLLAGAAAALVAWHYRHQPSYMLRRYDSLIDLGASSQVKLLLINVFLRSVPPICLIVSLMQRRKAWWCVGLTALFSLVASMPTAVPRYQVAAMSLPLAILLLPVLRRRKALTLSIVLLLVTVFPLLNLARVQRYGEPFTFSALDFDAYQNLLCLMRIELVTYGRQFLGVVLFFVPRAMWPGKPAGSGFEMADQIELCYHNVSMPIFGEGYINFGIFGAIAFTAAVGLLFRRLDDHYSLSRMNLSTLLYLLLFGETIFLLRGALMPGFAALCAYFAVALIAYLPARALGAPRQKTTPKNDP